MEHDIDQDSSCEQDNDLEDDQEDEGDDRDNFDMLDITVEDIKQIRQFVTPNVHEILNVTMVDEWSDFNPDNDIEELEKLLANDPKPHYMEIQLNSVIINPKPFIHTQPMNPLYGIFEPYKSSTAPYKVDREIKSPFRGLTSRGWNSRSHRLVLCA
nr:hypothetical protein [Tanacetum cinerariifolium]